MTRAACTVSIFALVAVAAVVIFRSSAFSVATQPSVSVDAQHAGLAQRNSAQFLASNGSTETSMASAFVAAGFGAVALSALVARASVRTTGPKTTFVSLSSSVEPTALGGYARDQLVACRAQLEEAGEASVEEVDEQMEAIKQFKDQVVGTAATALFTFSAMADSAGAYPIFAQQNYKYPQEANGKIACANCHLASKSINVRMPKEVVPETIFRSEIFIPAKYDIKRQPAADGTKAEMNVGAVAIFPEGFKLAPRDRLPKAIKKEMKGLAWAPYSKEYPNVVVAGPVPGAKFNKMILPMLAPVPDGKTVKTSYGKLEVSYGGNRGRGQVYPTGDMSNNNEFQSPIAGTITSIEGDEKKKTVTITSDKGETKKVDVLIGATFITQEGQKVKKGEALTTNPNVGGFGQEDKDLVLQDPNRVYAVLGVCFSLFISQLSFVLKKKQFEKVQLAEGF